MISRRPILLVVCLALSAQAPAVQAAPAAQAAGSLVQQRAHELNLQKQKIEAKRRQIRELSAKEATIKRSISEVQQKLERTETQLSDTQYRFQQASVQVAKTSQQLQQIEIRYERQVASAQRRLRAIYKLSPNQALSSMLSATDLSSLIRRMAYFQHVAKQDSELIGRLARTQQEMISLRRQQEARKQAFARISQEYSAKKGQYANQAEELGTYRQQLRTQIAVNERELRLMEQESRQIEAMLRRLRASQGSSNKRLGTGRMMAPVVGPFGSPFGTRMHPIFKRSIHHSGQDFPVAHGTPIRAADGGRVIESGWRGGYGKVVIIDHGGGIATLYAHCSTLHVNAGQMVTKGQVIAAVGSTGYSTGPHLHFEVRQNGTPVDPRAWL